MNIHEKLKIVLSDRVLSVVAEKAGIKVPSFRQAITRESAITTDWAMRIAKACDLDPHWLIDDGQGLPVKYAPADRRQLATSEVAA